MIVFAESSVQRFDYQRSAFSMSAGGVLDMGLVLARIFTMSVPQLKMECSRLGLEYSSSISKPMLQMKVRQYYDQQALARPNPDVHQMPQQQKNDEVMKDEAIDDQDGVICTICYEEYSDSPIRTPRLLPCGHTFCTDCVKSFNGQKGPNMIVCPACSKQLQLPAQAGGVNACPISKYVPINFYAKDVSTRIAFMYSSES